MTLTRILRAGRILAVVALMAMVGTASHAFPKFAKKEMVMCTYCHANPGGPRNFRGLFYKAHKLSFDDFDEQFESKAAGVAPASMGPDAMSKNPDYPNVKVAPALNFVVKDIDGKTVNLGRYQGNVILVVNVASKCGNTPQYASLEKIYADYKAKGFTVLAFPANDFGQQEPGTNQEIKAFCAETYKVAFPLFSKITVKGDDTAPLYKFLTDKATDPMFGAPIEWNFAKFLINRKGEIVARFPAKTDPMKDAATFDKIKKEIAEPAPEKTASAQ